MVISKNIFNTQIPIYLWRRHLSLLIRYATPRKIFNATTALWNYSREKPVISTMPLLLKVELSRYCTVNCLYCFSKKEYRFYPFDKFKLLVDTFGKYIFMTQLYEIGEPLHHPELLKCIHYAHSNGLGTVISTTLSLKKSDSYWNDLVASGLDKLIVAIDGTTGTIYNKYRTQGNLILVMDNLKKIIQIKSQTQSNLFIEWQMIDFPWNRCEQNVAKELANTLGCDDFRIIQDTFGRQKIYQKSKKIRNKNCIWSYLLLLVNVYGDVIPCFKPGFSPGKLGNLNDTTFTEIWNGEEIQQIRSKILIKSRDGCCTCNE